jgi:hypothetical protein
MGWVLKHHTIAALLLGETRYPLCRMGGIWGLVQTGTEYLALTVVQTLDCPKFSEFLYHLHYPGCHRDAVYELFIDPEDGDSMLHQNDGNDLPDDGAT